MTYTYALLEISESAWNEIAASLVKAGYKPDIGDMGEIDMQGIALVKKPPRAPLPPGTIAQRFRQRYVVWRGR